MRLGGARLAVGAGTAAIACGKAKPSGSPPSWIAEPWHDVDMRDVTPAPVSPPAPFVRPNPYRASQPARAAQNGLRTRR